MQYSILAVAALASVVSAASNGTYSLAPVWVTDIVTDYTTFCPASTVLTAYGATYTITEATTVVLPCPCTSSYLVTPTAPVAPYPTSTAPVAPVSTYPASVYPVSSAVISPVYSNSTTAIAPYTTVAPTSPVGTVAPVAPTTSAFTGAANSMAAPAGALAGVLGLAAYFL